MPYPGPPSNEFPYEQLNRQHTQSGSQQLPEHPPAQLIHGKWCSSAWKTVWEQACSLALSLWWRPPVLLGLVCEKSTCFPRAELQQGLSARSRLPQPSAYPRGPSGLPCQRLVISRVRSRPRPPTAGGPETAVFDVGCAWHPGRTGEPSERALPRAPARQRGPAWVDRRTAAGREGTFP